MKISCMFSSLFLFVSTTQSLKDNSLSIKEENINHITLYFVKKIMVAMKRWNDRRFSIAKFNRVYDELRPFTGKESYSKVF